MGHGWVKYNENSSLFWMSPSILISTEMQAVEMSWTYSCDKRKQALHIEFCWINLLRMITFMMVKGKCVVTTDNVG
jgi:hypothetical protein